MRKIRFLRIITIMLLLLIKNISIFTIIISSPAVQSFLTKRTIELFSYKYNLDLSVKKVYLRFPNKLVLDDVFLPDESGDTLIYTKKLYASLSGWKLLENQVYINQLNLIEPFLNIKIDSAGVANYEYILNKFSSSTDSIEKDSNYPSIFCNNFKLVNARINYINTGVIPIDSLFDFSYISLNRVNLFISNLNYNSDSIDFRLDVFNFLERSGFKMNEISTKVLIHPTGITMHDLIFRTINSQILFSEISISGKNSDYLSNPLNKMKVDLILDDSYFDLSDLTYFVPGFKSKYDKVFFKGNFNGSLSRFRLKDFQLSYGTKTILNANLSVDGLPDLNQTFIFGDISEFYTTNNDINRLANSIGEATGFSLPAIFEKLGFLSFSGNITGLFNDVVAYGQFNTGIGTLRTDLGIISDLEKGSFLYNGELIFDDVNLGILLSDEERFGNISFNAILSGDIDTTGRYNTKIDCDIRSLRFYGYEYKNLTINGLSSNDFYEGKLKIQDPNLKIDFDGLFDNRSEYPKIKFYADIYTDLNNMGLIQDSINYTFRLKCKTDLTGDLLNMPVGEVQFRDIVFIKDVDLLLIDSILIKSYFSDNLIQNLELRSDYIDLDFNGKYRFSEMIEKLSTLIYNYFPSITDEDFHDDLLTDNKANFKLKIKNFTEISKVFVPEFSMDDDLIITGKINTLSNAIEAEINTSKLIYDSIYAETNKINIKTYPDSIDINIQIGEFGTTSFILLENVDFDINIHKDSIYFILTWNDFASPLNSGDVKFSSTFHSREKHFPIIKTNIYNSSVIIHDRDWIAGETSIIIDTTNINIDKFKLTYENQTVLIDGDISEDPTKRLRFLISDVQATNFNSFLEETGYWIEGIISGNGRIANLYSSPSFRSSISIEDFKINNEDFGRFDISGSYDALTGGFILDGANKYMRIKGNYNPESDTIDMNINVENFNLSILAPYLKEFDISNLTGSCNIFIDAYGLISNPEINGFISFNQTKFVYDFLKLSLSTNDRIKITNNAISFENFKIFDDSFNQGTINGGIYHNNFNDLHFDFNLFSDKMQVLNTSERDNSLYYGSVMASANVRIKGTPENFGIDVKGKTQPGTVFILPMTESYEQREIGFISFVSSIAKEDTLDVLDPLSSRMDYYFKMDVEVTPDAEAQIVFDPKVGDLIRGFTRGNIKMEYTSDEEFYMYGELEVVEGDYLFTLQNVINKRFHIKPGGTIIWDGDPYEARIDLDAVYYLRAPLIDLMRAVNDTSDTYRRQTNIECHMHMSGNLMSPDITFSINIPNADDKAKAQLANMTQDEINKQLLYLLILNRFYAPDELRADNTSTTNAFGVTSSELLSNQLSNWLSQISKDFDIGFKYRPGTEVSGQELELALSTQILNERVLINGNFGYGENQTTSTTNLVGDVEVQFKVTPKGSFRIKGFTRANDELSSELGPYTSGMGIFYTEDFNTFGELFRKFYNKITFKDRRTKDK